MIQKSHPNLDEELLEPISIFGDVVVTDLLHVLVLGSMYVVIGQGVMLIYVLKNTLKCILWLGRSRRGCGTNLMVDGLPKIPKILNSTMLGYKISYFLKIDICIQKMDIFG